MEQSYRFLYTQVDGESNFVTAIRDVISKCETSLDIVAHRIDNVFFSQFATELEELCLRNVRFRILVSTAHIENITLTIETLLAKYPILQCRVASNIHAKAIVCDGHTVIFGSANLSGDSIGFGSDWTDATHFWNRPNFEVGLLVANQNIALSLTEKFDYHWSIARDWK